MKLPRWKESFWSNLLSTWRRVPFIADRPQNIFTPPFSLYCAISSTSCNCIGPIWFMMPKEICNEKNTPPKGFWFCRPSMKPLLSFIWVFLFNSCAPIWSDWKPSATRVNQKVPWLLFRPNLRRFHTNERHICLWAALHLFCEKTIMDQLPPRLLFRYSQNKPLGTTDVGGCAMCLWLFSSTWEDYRNFGMCLCYLIVWFVADGRSFQTICNMLA